MRNKTADQEYLDFSTKSTLKVVQEYRRTYEKAGRILEANPQILNIAHCDFAIKLNQGHIPYFKQESLPPYISLSNTRAEGGTSRNIICSSGNF